MQANSLQKNQHFHLALYVCLAAFLVTPLTCLFVCLYFLLRENKTSLPSRINIHNHGRDRMIPLRIHGLNFLRGKDTDVWDKELYCANLLTNWKTLNFSWSCQISISNIASHFSDNRTSWQGLVFNNTPSLGEKLLYASTTNGWPGLWQTCNEWSGKGYRAVSQWNNLSV